METITLATLNDTEQLVETVLQEVQKQAYVGAVVIALHGDLGAGKTTFTQLLAKKVGVTETVTSPTFVIMKMYELLQQSYAKLIHIDAYRIEEIDEMRVLRFEQLLEQKDTMMCIEWAERIEALLPKDTLHINFTLTGDTRFVTITHGNDY